MGRAGCTPTSNADAAIGIAIMRYFVAQDASILILRGHANGFYNPVLLCFFDSWSLSKHQAATYQRVADDFDALPALSNALPEFSNTYSLEHFRNSYSDKFRR